MQERPFFCVYSDYAMGNVPGTFSGRAKGAIAVSDVSES